MKTLHIVALSILAGMAVGAVAIQGLHAQAQLPVSMIAINEISNPDGYAILPPAPIKAMMLDIVVIIIAASIVWLVWLVRQEKKKEDEIALDDAWREVLDDPHYTERRHLEERKRVVDKARAAAVNR